MVLFQPTKFSEDVKVEVINDDEEMYHDYDFYPGATTTESLVISSFENNEKLINEIKPNDKKVVGWMHKNNIGFGFLFSVFWSDQWLEKSQSGILFAIF